MATRLMKPLIVVGTKVLRRGPVSGETLLTPRQRLQRLRASPFDLLYSTKHLRAIARAQLRAEVCRARAACALLCLTAQPAVVRRSVPRA
jgi:hypothetical protein